MKEFHIIEDFIDLTDTHFALSGTSALDGESYTMASSADVLGEINDNFGERAIYADTNAPMDYFTVQWQRWLRRRSASLAAGWQALNTEYNPLENYNRTETKEGSTELTHGEAITHTGADTGTDNLAITPSGHTVTSTPGVETTVTVTPAETTEKTTPGVETTVTTTPAETTEKTTPGIETTVTTTPAETTEKTTPGVETTVTTTPAETTTTNTPAETTTTVTPEGKKTTTENSKMSGASQSREATSSIYAFNSSNPVPVSIGTETDSGKVVETVEAVQGGDGVTAVTVNTAASEAVTVDAAGSEVTSKTGFDKIERTTDAAGSEVTSKTGFDKIERTTDAAGSEVTSKTGFDKVERTTDTAGSEVTSVTGHDTVKTVYDNNAAENRTLNLYHNSTDTHSGKDTTEEGYELHVSGNIGTMSTQNMATQELELRKHDFVYAAILEFINLYTVYA